MGILGGAAISGLLGIGSALIGSDSASSAADAQVQAANTASQTELNMFNQTSAREQPWVSSGQNALSQLMNGMGLAAPPASSAPSAPNPSSYLSQFPWLDNYSGHYPSPQPTIPHAGPSTTGPGSPGFGSLTQPFTQQQFQASPGYQYQLDQGNQAIQNSSAARGGLVSGNALKALQANGIGLANQDWWNAQNNYQQQQQQRFNMLQTLSGSGQNAAADLGSLGSQVAGSIGANQIGAGNSAAAGSVAQGQIWSNLLNNSSFLNGIQSMFGGGGGGVNLGFMGGDVPVNFGATSPLGINTDLSSLVG